MKHTKCNKILKNIKNVRDINSRMASDAQIPANGVYKVVVYTYNIILEELKIDNKKSDTSNILSFETKTKEGLDSFKVIDGLVKQNVLYTGDTKQFIDETFAIIKGVREHTLKLIQDEIK